MGTISTPSTVWNVAKPAPPDTFKLFPEYPRAVVQMLANRGLTDDESVAAFLDPVYTRDVPDPNLLSGMADAVRTIGESLKRNDRIVVHGDYDADGLTATALLVDVLTALGAQVEAFIPSRYEEGYGVAEKTLGRLAADGAGLVVTVDCGISSAEAIAVARASGLKVVVTDHHVPPKRVPKAEAVINPNLPGDRYPNKALTGVGVAFKLAQALLARHQPDRKRREASEKWLLDLVAIGTVADLAELRGENRALVRYGLLVLKQTRRPGLQALMRLSGIEPTSLTGRSLGYAVAPRLNAPGRLGHAREALDLLCTDDPTRAGELAGKIEQINRERRALTDEVAEAAKRGLPSLTDDDRIIILDGDWKSGVVGLVAGQLSRDLNRPAVVIERGPDVSRGSVRSIPGFHVAEALQAHATLLETYGGHAQAGGFSIETVKLETFREQLSAYARAQLSPEDLRPTLAVEAELAPAELGWELLEHLERFEPFGVGNPEPTLLLRDVAIVRAATVGAGGDHLKLESTLAGDRPLTILAFGQGNRHQELSPGSRVDVVGRPISNEFNGQKSLEWHATDFRPA